ncbi:MAG: hypothetical protein HY073_05675 [Deltaproteobacteria bacterium]|nr:hypothetical protein [Deltaproteobacteria bacterium]
MRFIPATPYSNGLGGDCTVTVSGLKDLLGSTAATSTFTFYVDPLPPSGQTSQQCLAAARNNLPGVAVPNDWNSEAMLQNVVDDFACCLKNYMGLNDNQEEVCDYSCPVRRATTDNPYYVCNPSVQGRTQLLRKLVTVFAGSVASLALSTDANNIPQNLPNSNWDYFVKIGEEIAMAHACDNGQASPPNFVGNTSDGIGAIYGMVTPTIVVAYRNNPPKNWKSFPPVTTAMNDFDNMISNLSNDGSANGSCFNSPITGNQAGRPSVSSRPALMRYAFEGILARALSSVGSGSSPTVGLSSNSANAVFATLSGAIFSPLINSPVSQTCVVAPQAQALMTQMSTNCTTPVLQGFYNQLTTLPTPQGKPFDIMTSPTNEGKVVRPHLRNPQ